MFQIRGRVHGPFVPELLRQKADSCTDVISNTHIQLTSVDVCTQTHKTKTRKRHRHVEQYEEEYVGHVCSILSDDRGDLAELPLDSRSDVLFSSYEYLFRFTF